MTHYELGYCSGLGLTEWLPSWKRTGTRVIGCGYSYKENQDTEVEVIRKYQLFIPEHIVSQDGGHIILDEAYFC